MTKTNFTSALMIVLALMGCALLLYSLGLFAVRIAGSIYYEESFGPVRITSGILSLMALCGVLYLLRRRT